MAENTLEVLEKTTSDLPLNNPIMFRVDDEMLKLLPSKGRNLSAFCRKSVEVFVKIMNSPNTIQQNVLNLLGYNSMNIFEKVMIFNNNSNTVSIPSNNNNNQNSEQIRLMNELKEKNTLYREALKIFDSLFSKFNQTLKEKKMIDIPSFKILKPTSEDMAKIIKALEDLK